MSHFPIKKSAFLFLFLLSLAVAEVKLPAIFDDNMVLQQKSTVNIWGWADKEKTVSVTVGWTDRAKTAKVRDDGTWRLKIKTPAAGGPYAITISGENSIHLKNILLGEVWLCAGQSNMDMWVTKGDGKLGVLNYREELKNAANSEIRLFKVKRKISTEPLTDCTGTWKECDSASVAKFSAVAFFFAKELYAKLQVPIGLIQSSWGGTVAESWTRLESLEKDDDCRVFTEKYYHRSKNEAQKEQLLQDFDKEMQDWRDNSCQKDSAAARLFTSINYDDKAWRTMTLPGRWNIPELNEYKGVVWFRKEFILDEDFIEENVFFDLGPVNDMDRTYVNGQLIGEVYHRGQYNYHRKYDLPKGLLQKGKNVVAIRVTNYTGIGGIYNQNCPLTIEKKETSEKMVSLKGDWRYKKMHSIKELPAVPDSPKLVDKNTASCLFNGMINPLIPYSIRGVIWYQGESNRHTAYLYRKLFPLMVKDWRRQWGLGNFPFYYVQIAPYKYKTDSPIAAELRESQLLSMKMKNTGMAVTMDIGDVRDIHPRNKQEVGRRLSLWALANTCHQKNVVYSGPLYKKMKIEGSRIRIYFKHCDGGLMSEDSLMQDFRIAGNDRIFKKANIKIDKNTIIVYSGEVDQPVAVRYGWGNAVEPKLFNGYGLPASPFRTDDWPLSTATALPGN